MEKEVRKIISHFILYIEDRCHIHVFPPSIYIRAAYLVAMGRRLNLENPKCFTEKIQWMKLYDKNSFYTAISDKLQVKEYIKKKAGIQFVVPTLGKWNDSDDIVFNDLPEKFVVKCTHDCESATFFDKSRDDGIKLKHRLSRLLKNNYYYVTREWCYKNIHPQIMIEPILQDKEGKLWDYKFFCFDGKVRFFKIDFDRFVNHKANYYSPEGKFLDFGEAAYPRDPDREVSIPDELPKMIEIAEKLSYGFYFLRVDMYNIDGEVKVGELTVYPGSGLLRYDPDEWDYKIGKFLRLPGKASLKD